LPGVEEEWTVRSKGRRSDLTKDGFNFPEGSPHRENQDPTSRRMPQMSSAQELFHEAAQQVGQYLWGQ
jgi:hypothetical protein